MIGFLETQILFYLSLVFILLLPGYFLLLAVFRKDKILEPLEQFAVSFGLSLIVLDFLAFSYSKLNISLSAVSIVSGVAVFCGVCFGIYKYHVIASETKQSQNVKDNLAKREIATVVPLPRNDDSNLFSFSKNQFILILLSLFLMFFLKTVYLSGSVAPTATDMGHHMYWAKMIADTGRLTDYEGMPDFIIGEHIVFSMMNILSGADFFSAFPVILLYLVNILGILAAFVLVLRITKNRKAAILSLLFLGIIYAVSSPQAKYVSGGVIGNIFGNYLMPLAFYFYYRSFEFLGEKNHDNKNSSRFLSLAIFVTFGLFYTHHLTSFIFLFVFSSAIIFYAALNYGDIEVWGKKVLKLVFSPLPIITFLLGLFFFFFVFTPTYVNSSAIDTAVGTPVKNTRVGLSLAEIESTVGEARFALGILGLFILALVFRRKNFGYSVIASWTIMLFVMSAFPDWLFIDLPSSRVGNYTTYPLAILSAVGFSTIFSPEFLRRDFGRFSFSHKLLNYSFLSILVFVLVLGISDSTANFKSVSENFQPMAETYAASKYLAKTTSSGDVVLKDHNYLSSDSWMKLFFMRGYKYPLSRGFFKRYEDETKPRENCTLTMISDPESDDAKFCFSETGVNFIAVNPLYDAPQFQRIPDFDKVYASEGVGVFYRK